MGVYRARDLIRVPGLLSLSRLPLAAAFPFTLDRPVVALALLCAAGFSDMADGWYARKFAQVTPTGVALDPMTDKLFVLTVAITLVRGGRLSAADVLLLSTRELGELPLVLWIATSTRARSRRAAHPAANAPGKLATFFQFGTATAALFRFNELQWMIAAAALAGAFAATTYWARELRDRREDPGERNRQDGSG
ncbi:MAG TPA: CDP-alcohol phosphatidyltransferase family protein [Polyangiaceae bacterium]|jgi:CDP-diacylglycerol--glycerol-3-phosphate 3-phosphatidyltransferase/cardiolipin synthase|nr:CDP-alcohol phosphatidyltransferase family protein [Polyangiaceae bacterium]